MTPERNRVAVTAFLVATLFGGANSVGVRVSNRELAPLWGAGLRFGLAALVFVILFLARRLELPRGRALTGSILYGLFNFAGAFSLAYYALVKLQAGLGQTLLSLVPLITMLIAVAIGQEQLRAAVVVGATIAVAGLALMTGASFEGDIPVLSVLAAVGSAACFAAAAVVVRGSPRVDPITQNAIGMSAGAAVLLIGALIAGDPIALPTVTGTWVALSYLVLVGSVLVFGLMLVVLKYWEASRTSYAFLLLPFISIALSTWIDDEQITSGLILGGLLVIVGVYVGALRGTMASPHESRGTR